MIGQVAQIAQHRFAPLAWLGHFDRIGLRLSLGDGDLEVLEGQLAVVRAQLLRPFAIDHLMQFFDIVLQTRVHRFKLSILSGQPGDIFAQVCKLCR